jgi:hypothetical protein
VRVQLSTEAVTYVDYVSCSNMYDDTTIEPAKAGYGQHKGLRWGAVLCVCGPVVALLVVLDVLSSWFPNRPRFRAGASLLQETKHVAYALRVVDSEWHGYGYTHGFWCRSVPRYGYGLPYLDPGKTRTHRAGSRVFLLLARVSQTLSSMLHLSAALAKL